MKKKFFLSIFLLLLATFFSDSIEAQCAMCKVTIENNQDGKNISLVSGLNKGILYLMAIPYILVSIVIYAWYKHSKKYKSID